MPFDEKLAERIRLHLQDRSDVEEKKMFGGLCFMVSNHMCCGIVKETLMARVGPDHYDECLKKRHATVMDFTGRSMKGMVYVKPEGLKSDNSLARWIDICTNFVDTLPPKSPR